MCVMPPVTPAPESPGYCHQLESAHLGAVMEGCDWSRARCLSYLCDQASPPIGQHSAIPLVRAPGHWPPALKTNFREKSLGIIIKTFSALSR